MFKSKKLSLLMALVFAFTVIFPFGAAFAGDEAKISGSYKYVSTGKDKEAGTVTVKEDDGLEGADKVTVRLTLPDGVEFKEEPDDSWSTIEGVYYESMESMDFDSDYYEVEFNGPEAGFNVDFKFVGDQALKIKNSFTGNLDVDVEVIGEKGSDVIWTQAKAVTIAKVSGGDVAIVVGDKKKVSVGGKKLVADITLEESSAGSLTDDNNTIYLEVDTDGVDISSAKVSASRIVVEKATLTGGDKDDNDRYCIAVTTESSNIPGTVRFKDIKLDIAPDVTGDIEISVWDENGDIDDESVVVATVGDVTAEVDEIEDNDTVAYAGQKTDLDVEFTIKTSDGSNFEEGDIITFDLSVGEFVYAPKADGFNVKENDIKLYNDAESFYVTIPNSFDDDEITFEDFKVILDNDAEPGDLTLTISGDYGDLGDIVIGEVAKPFTVTAEKPAILTEALNQAAGDLLIKETDNDAFNKDDLIYVELPSGVELNAKPKIDVDEGNADAKIKSYEKDSFVIEITKTSGSKASVLRVYNLKYDTGKLALTGDVELTFRGDEDVAKSTKNYKDDSVMLKVANATVVDENVVTATFAVGDEGVAIKNGRTLVQVNTLCDVLGLQKSWDPTNKIAYFVKSGTVVAFPIDKNEITINGNVIPVDQGGTIINDFTYATLRGLEMAFGGKLDWDNDTKTATFDFVK